MADNRLKLAQGLRNLPDSAREDLAGYSDGFSKSQIADALRNAGEQGIGIAKSVARGIPQMATGFVDLAAMPFEAAGIVKPGQSVGSTKWLEEKGYLPPPQEGFVNQTAEMVASGLDPSTWASHALPLVAGIGKTVWHGSPHSFEKFDLSKIGTGEGAQMYGHGLYFADAPSTAMTYQPRDPRFEQNIMQKYSQAEKAGNYPAMQVYEDFLLHKNPDEIRSALPEFGLEGKDLEQAQNALDYAAKQYQEQTAGALYKVDLPDEQIAKMLDYDAPLKEQPYALEKIRSQIDDKDLLKSFDYNVEHGMSGANAYSNWIMGAKTNPESSKILNDLGVPGIQYLDQASRGAGDGTRNYVVFSDEIPQILERNNQPLVNALRDKKPTLQDVVSPIENRGVTIDVYESKNKPLMTLSRIEVPKEMRGQGVGSQAMQDLVNYANQSGKTMALSPSTDFGATSVGRLKDFYKQFGFVENKGRNKDFSISESMYRLPEAE